MITNLKIKKLEDNNEIVAAVKFLALESFIYYQENHLANFYNLDSSRQQEIKSMFLEKQLENFALLNGTIYAAYNDNKLIGAAYRCDSYLAYLFVSSKYRNQKVGSKLIEHLLKDCISYQVINLDASIKAVPLYQRYGFKIVGNNINKNSIKMELERSNYGK